MVFEKYSKKIKKSKENNCRIFNFTIENMKEKKYNYI